MINKLRKKLNGDIHLKEILAGSAMTFILKIFGMLLGYVVILIISRQYGAEGIGLYNLTLSILTLIAMLASMGLNVSILRYVGEFNKKGEEYKLKVLYYYAVQLIIPCSFVLAVLLYVFAKDIALNIFENKSYIPALEFAAFIIPFMTLQNISVEYIRGLKKLKVSEFLRSVNRPIINVILLLVFGLFIIDQLLPVYTLGIGIITSALFAFYYIYKQINRIQNKSTSNFQKKELILTSFPMMITALASFIMANISLFMLEIFTTTKEVGIYSVIFKLAMLINLVLLVVNTISAPKFSELYWSGKHEELQRVLNYSSKLIFFISFSISIIFYIFSEEFLGIFGKEFIIGNTAFLLLILGQLMYSITGSSGVFLNMIGKQVVLKNIITIAMFFSLLLNYLLIPKYGIDGAAMASVLVAMALNIFIIAYTYKKINFVVFYVPSLIRKTLLK